MASDDEPAPAGPQPVVRAGSNLGYVAYGAPQAPAGLDRASAVRPPPPRPGPTGSASGQRTTGARATWVAVLASVVLPGTGHWLLGRRGTAAVLLTTAAGYWLVVLATGVPALGAVLLWGVAAVATALTAGAVSHRVHRTARALDDRG